MPGGVRMNVTNNPVSAYRQTSVKTAGQGKLIVMLYDEAIRQIDRAVELMQIKPLQIENIHNALVKAQDVVTELMVGLDFEKGGEIAKNLLSIYIYVNEKLRDANIKKTIPFAQEARNIMAELQSAWAQLANQAPAPDDPENGIHIAG